MSPVTNLFSYKYLIPPSIKPTKLQNDQWAQNTKDSVEKMLANLESVVPDETAYGENVVTPAIHNWSNFVNPAFVSQKGETAADITGKMAARMQTSAHKYLNNVKQVMANGGALYKAAIDAKQANWAHPQSGTASYLLPITGSHGTGFMAAPFTVNALTGKSKAMRMAGENIIKGNIINIVTPGLESAFRVAMTGILIQMYIKFYFSLQTPEVINGKIVKLANAFVNTAVCNPFAYPMVPASSALYYARGGGNNQLCCQIVFGTP